MAFEHYIYTVTTRLRCGYTTGSCAALAAKAACEMLLSRKPVGRVSIVTPGGLPVEADVVDACIGEGCAQCAVRKDAGDDADVTDGVLVYARVEHAGSGTGAAGSKGVPARESEVSVDGGVGVGRVTLPGLEQPVGAAAINATPRAMIASAVREVCAAHGSSGNIAVTISVPEGVALAEKTFNPHLGIEDGISILGTTGIVEPRSLAALRDSIELEIRQHAAMGRRGVVLTPGNYGEQFISGHFHLNGAPVVVISNFVGDAIDCCVREGFTNVLLVGHIGKLVKVAGGIMDTHSRTADCRAEILAAHAALAGAGAKTVREIMSSVTTTAALEVIEAAGVGDAARASLAAAIEDRLRRRAAGACDIAAVVFDAERRELFRTSGNWGRRMSKGVLYGVGTGPGDPELLTIKAVRTIESCPVIAAPQTADGVMVALDIVRGAVDLTGKTVIPVRFSMTRDAERRAAEHASLVRELVAHLDAVRDVALLNLGDPSIYATFQRIAPDVRARGFEARAIPGVPSFCAVAAALERDLTPEMSSPLHIVPGGYDDVRRAIGWPGTKVVMKARRSLADTKRILREEGAFDGAELVEDCGLPSERVYRSLDDVPDRGSYFSTMVVR